MNTGRSRITLGSHPSHAYAVPLSGWMLGGATTIERPCAAVAVEGVVTASGLDHARSVAEPALDLLRGLGVVAVENDDRITAPLRAAEAGHVHHVRGRVLLRPLSATVLGPGAYRRARASPSGALLWVICRASRSSGSMPISSNARALQDLIDKAQQSQGADFHPSEISPAGDSPPNVTCYCPPPPLPPCSAAASFSGNSCTHNSPQGMRWIERARPQRPALPSRMGRRHP